MSEKGAVGVEVYDSDILGLIEGDEFGGAGIPGESIWLMERTLSAKRASRCVTDRGYDHES